MREHKKGSNNSGNTKRNSIEEAQSILFTRTECVYIWYLLCHFIHSFIHVFSFRTSSLLKHVNPATYRGHFRFLMSLCSSCLLFSFYLQFAILIQPILIARHNLLLVVAFYYMATRHRAEETNKASSPVKLSYRTVDKEFYLSLQCVRTYFCGLEMDDPNNLYLDSGRVVLIKVKWRIKSVFIGNNSNIKH